MGGGSEAKKPALGSKKPFLSSQKQKGQGKQKQDIDVEIVVSEKVAKKLGQDVGVQEEEDTYEQRNALALAEYEHFKKMLDRVIGQDEHI